VVKAKLEVGKKLCLKHNESAVNTGKYRDIDNRIGGECANKKPRNLQEICYFSPNLVKRRKKFVCHKPELSSISEKTMLSYWERDAWTQYDVVIIGAGIIGLSTAISLKEHSPKLSVAVLERGLIPSGASTRNAGFACFGSLTEILHDIAANGEEATAELVRARYAGLHLLRQRLGDEACGYEQHGGAELLFENNVSALDQLERVNSVLGEIFPQKAFYVNNAAIAQNGFNTEHVKALVQSDFEGQIHSGKMMRSLTALAQERGVMLFFGADVQQIEERDAATRLHVRHNEEITVMEAAQVVLCTNAFTAQFAPDLGITPGRGQVLVTSPISELRFRGVFHFDEGFYYFRNISSPEGQRILCGGGRNMAFAAEKTTALELNDTIQQELERLLHEVIAPGAEFSVEQRWSGIMGFHQSKLPIVRRVRERVVVGFGCNGMGVALGSTIGGQTAECLLKQ
jgi:glycine/D-amino acid oxidase-like deaminating enzyme